MIIKMANNVLKLGQFLKLTSLLKLREFSTSIVTLHYSFVNINVDLIYNRIFM